MSQLQVQEQGKANPTTHLLWVYSMIKNPATGQTLGLDGSSNVDMLFCNSLWTLDTLFYIWTEI